MFEAYKLNVFNTSGSLHSIRAISYVLEYDLGGRAAHVKGLVRALGTIAGVLCAMAAKGNTVLMLLIMITLVLIMMVIITVLVIMLLTLILILGTWTGMAFWGAFLVFVRKYVKAIDPYACIVAALTYPIVGLGQASQAAIYNQHKLAYK